MSGVTCRKFLVVALMGLLSFAGSAQAHTNDWPSKPIRLIVGFSAGGVADGMTRALAQALAPRLGTQVIVENRPGADSLIASQRVARADPDGYTLYMASTAHAVNQNMFKDAGFDAVHDFTPISKFTELPNAIAVSASLPVSTLQEFIDHAKQHGDALNYASSASGTFLATELFMRDAGVRLQRVPYKGAAPAIVALLANQVELMLTAIGGIAQHQDAGQIKILAVAGTERSALTPDVPTAEEAGLKHVSSTWYALLGPPQMPREIVDRINAETREILNDPAFVQDLAKFGAVVQSSSPEALAAFMETEVQQWKEIILETGSQQ